MNFSRGQMLLVSLYIFFVFFFDNENCDSELRKEAVVQLNICFPKKKEKKISCFRKATSNVHLQLGDLTCPGFCDTRLGHSYPVFLISMTLGYHFFQCGQLLQYAVLYTSKLINNAKNTQKSYSQFGAFSGAVYFLLLLNDYAYLQYAYRHYIP